MHKSLQDEQLDTVYMEIFWPMVVSAIAVLITLVYTSWLDIRDRRVPFVHWMPMLAVGVTCTAYLIWQTTANASLLTGYLALVVSFLYADYLDNRGRTDSLYLTGYYAKKNIWSFLGLVLLLPILSWFVLAPAVSPQVVAWYAMFAGIFLYVSWMEYKGLFEDDPANRRRDTLATAIGRWYFVLIVMILTITAVTMMLTPDAWGMPAALVIFPAVFCGVFYTFGRMNLFGGADAWALIFIAFCVPVFPATPLLGTPLLGFFAFSVLINALILNLATPLGIFLINLARRNRAPFMYMFFGFPVPGDTIAREWGFVMEDFAEKDGRMERRFIGFWDAIRRMYAGKNRIYTKDLREHPEEFRKELAAYKKAGTVWISYAVPFIIPITAGFITAAVFGDILFTLMTFIF